MKNDEIHLTDAFENFLKSVYGNQAYHQTAGIKTTDEWSKIILRLVDFAEKSIENTIRTVDAEHKQELMSNIKNIKKNIKSEKSLNELNEQIVLGLFKTMFLLIGEIPDNYVLNKLNNASHWRLNNYRQIVYLQTDKQKVKLIINNAPQFESTENQTHNKNYLLNKLNEDFNGNYSRFLDWYIAQYRDNYFSMFILNSQR
jgi:hypothetical protein